VSPEANSCRHYRGSRADSNGFVPIAASVQPWILVRCVAPSRRILSSFFGCRPVVSFSWVGEVWKMPKHDHVVEIEVVGDQCSRMLCSVAAEIFGGRCCWRRTPSTKIPSAAIMMILELHFEHKLLVVVGATP